MTINQIYFDNFGSSTSSGSTILAIDNSQLITENVGVIMYLLLMGTFNISAPILAIRSTPSSDSSLVSFVPFRTLYLVDPWTLPSLSTSNEYARTTRIRMLLFVEKVAYQTALYPTIEPGPSCLLMENYIYNFIPYTIYSHCIKLLG